LNSSQYQKLLKHYKEQGLYLGESIERVDVGGYYGMRTTGSIKKGQVIASLPYGGLPQISPNIKYPSDMPEDIKYIHKVAYEYQKGSASDHEVMFNGFETLDALKSTATYYFTDEELAIIKGASITLYNTLIDIKRATQYRLDKIIEFDSALEKDNVLFVAINHLSRAWGNLGFLPIIDLFNHSDEKGMNLTIQDGVASWVAGFDYKEGDEVYGSYGRKDLNLIAVGFNYFDPANDHSINFGSRFSQLARSPFEKQVFKLTQEQHKVRSFEKNGQIQYKVADPDAVFTEKKPSDNLLAYLSVNSISTLEEFVHKKCSKTTLKARLKRSLLYLNEANNIDKFCENDFSGSLHRFYHLLKKEQKMIRANLEWLDSKF